MALTSLERLEDAAHRQFPDRRPTKDALSQFIQRQIPRMDISVAIALAALALQGWQAYTEWRKKPVRRGNRDPFASRMLCPECERPAITITKDGKCKCAKNHVWYLIR